MHLLLINSFGISNVMQAIDAGDYEYDDGDARKCNDKREPKSLRSV